MGGGVLPDTCPGGGGIIYKFIDFFAHMYIHGKGDLELCTGLKTEPAPAPCLQILTHSIVEKFTALVDVNYLNLVLQSVAIPALQQMVNVLLQCCDVLVATRLIWW